MTQPPAFLIGLTLVSHFILSANLGATAALPVLHLSAALTMSGDDNDEQALVAKSFLMIIMMGMSSACRPIASACRGLYI